MNYLESSSRNCRNNYRNICQDRDDKYGGTRADGHPVRGKDRKITGIRAKIPDNLCGLCRKSARRLTTLTPAMVIAAGPERMWIFIPAKRIRTCRELALDRFGPSSFCCVAGQGQPGEGGFGKPDLRGTYPGSFTTRSSRGSSRPRVHGILQPGASLPDRRECLGCARSRKRRIHGPETAEP